MAITVGWATDQVIFVPKADMTLVQSTPVEIRRLDTDAFFLTLKDLESSQEGMPWPNTQRNASPVLLGGITYARVLEIIDPYTVTFEDGLYVVQLVGSNNNIIEKTNPNQVSVQGNNAAGLIQVDEIQYSSFQNGVTVDIVGGTAGQEYNIGTPANPSNNFVDALFIANFRGFNTFYVLGDAVIDSGQDYTDKRFVGQGQNLSLFTLDAAAVLSNCAFFDADVTGVLDGDSRLEDCIISGLTFVTGVIERCILNPATIVLGGSQTAYLIDCRSGVPGTGTPTIDCGGSGRGLAVRNYNGGIKLTNKTGPESVSIDLNAGQVKLDTTVTNGTIVVRGVGKLVDDSTGRRIYSGTWNGGVTIVNELIDSEDTSQIRYIDQRVHVNTELLANGVGAVRDPFNNWPDSVDYAEANNLTRMAVYADAVIDRQLRNFEIEGFGAPVIDFNNQILDGTIFRRCNLTGTVSSATPSAIQGIENFLTDVLNLAGAFSTVAIVGTVRAAPNDSLFMINVAPAVAGTSWTLDMNTGQPSLATIHDISGEMVVRDMDDIGDTVDLHFANGRLIIDATCTAGTLTYSGDVEVVDNSNGTTIVPRASGPRIYDIFKMHGLELGNPMTVTPTSRQTQDNTLDQVISGDGENISTVTRQ